MTRSMFVQWAWTFKGIRFSEEDLLQKWGREVVERNGLAIWPGSAVYPLQSFVNDKVIVADIGVQPEFTRDNRLRGKFPPPIIYLRDTWNIVLACADRSAADCSLCETIGWSRQSGLPKDTLLSLLTCSVCHFDINEDYLKLLLESTAFRELLDKEHAPLMNTDALERGYVCGVCRSAIRVA